MLGFLCSAVISFPCWLLLLRLLRLCGFFTPSTTQCSSCAHSLERCTLLHPSLGACFPLTSALQPTSPQLAGRALVASNARNVGKGLTSVQVSRESVGIRVRSQYTHGVRACPLANEASAEDRAVAALENNNKLPASRRAAGKWRPVMRWRPWRQGEAYRRALARAGDTASHPPVPTPCEASRASWRSWLERPSWLHKPSWLSRKTLVAIWQSYRGGQARWGRHMGVERGSATVTMLQALLSQRV